MTTPASAPASVATPVAAAAAAEPPAAAPVAVTEAAPTHTVAPTPAATTVVVPPITVPAATAPTEKKKGTPRKVYPCQACGRTLDSNRYMSAGLKERITKYLPLGAQFKVKDMLATIAVASDLPQLRSNSSFLCQSCIKYLNSRLKEEEEKLNPKPEGMALVGSAAVPTVPAVAPTMHHAPPAPAHAQALAPAPVPTASRTPGRTNVAAPAAVSVGAPAVVEIAAPVAAPPSAVVMAPTPTFGDISDERGRVQDERAALQEERTRFLNDRAKLQDERAQLAAELHQVRMQLKTVQEENGRLRQGLALMCEDVVRRTRELVPAPAGSAASVGEPNGKRQRVMH